jgi:hypothetical protein
VVETTYELETLLRWRSEARRDSDAQRDERSAARLYVEDCQAGVTRWNKILERHGLSIACACRPQVQPGHWPVRRGSLRPQRPKLSDEEWTRRKYEWLPHESDKRFLLSINERVDLRTGPVRQLHRAAGARNQRHARELRVRADEM